MIFHAPTTRDAVRQAQRWLEHEFPTPYPVRVLWRPRLAEQNLGHTKLEPHPLPRVARGRFVICLDGRWLRHREPAIEVPIHEWAHCISWPIPEQEWVEQVPDHSDEWGLAYARVYRLYYDGGGREHSLEFPWRRG